MWEQIQSNKRKAKWLIIGMGTILALMGYSIAEAVSSGLGSLGVIGALIILGVQLGLYAMVGESMIMAGLGARPMTREESPRLFNIVEEMQIASGLGFMPQIYLIDTDAPNAFAVGRKPETSIVAVTRGLLYRLDRDELQGVIAHEIAHLKNLDTKFMTLAGVVLGSIIILADMASRFYLYGGRGRSRSSSRGSDNNSSGAGQLQLIMLIVAVVLIVVGPILARILYFSLSRTREYLADASAAVYTRYPEGLASALLKISSAAHSPGSSLGEANRTVAAMFIVNPLKADAAESAFSTHPSVQDRVKVLRAMGGASFMDYDQAFQSVKQVDKPVIGPQTLQQSVPLAIRAASPLEADDPVSSRSETKAMVHAMAGYATIECTCGATLKVPPTYSEPDVRCIRCGAAYPVPEFSATKPQAKPVASTAPAGPPPLLRYTRKTPGIWEGFPCQCGASIQLSPAFSGNKMECRKCGATHIIE